jgi:hypothetical protein
MVSHATAESRQWQAISNSPWPQKKQAGILVTM